MDAICRKPIESVPVRYESGSFRDRSARIFIRDEKIYRTLNSESLATWRRVSSQPFIHQLIAGRQLVETQEVSLDTFRDLSFPAGVEGVLHHERVPFISYPYEWSFSMLREAALLHLRILSEAIRVGLILKDASPYNVQFQGSKPVFIDIGSFTEHKSGEPWIAYRQFCELMLFPLLLQAYRGVHFQPILRGQLEGVPARQFMQWMRWRDLFRPGVFSNGWLQSKLEQNTQAIRSSTVEDLAASGFQTSIIEQMFKKLTRLVEGLRWKPEATQWTGYDDSLPHVADDRQAKSDFVRRISHSRRRQLVWDLGCNDGRYSLIASERAETVIAMDQDHACIDRLFQLSTPNIVPLCVELANSSPAQGWRGKERKRLEERGRPDLTLCLGLIHHLVLASNIPLPEVVNWLASQGGEVVLEFPTKEDSMVKALLRNKRDQYDDYSLECLEAELSKYFEIGDRVALPSGHRTLIHAIPKFDGVK